MSKVGNPCPTLGQLLASRILCELLVGENEHEIAGARFCTQSCSKVGQLFLSFLSLVVLFYQGKSSKFTKDFPSLPNAWKPLESKEKPHSSKEIPCCKSTKEIQTIKERKVNPWSIPRQLPIPWGVAGVFLAVVLWQPPRSYRPGGPRAQRHRIANRETHDFQNCRRIKYPLARNQY